MQAGLEGYLFMQGRGGFAAWGNEGVKALGR